MGNRNVPQARSKAEPGNECPVSLGTSVQYTYHALSAFQRLLELRGFGLDLALFL